MKAQRISSFGLVLIFVAAQPFAFAEDFSGMAVPEESAVVLAVAADGEISRHLYFPAKKMILIDLWMFR
jgi:hypothetical protein